MKLTKKNIIEILALFSILILAGYLRLANLQTNPGWYSDEGTILEIARHVAQGEIQYLAINQSTLLAARLPLFPFIVAWITSLFGLEMGVLRVFTGLIGVLDVFLSYVIVRRSTNSGNVWLALLTAVSLAIFPKAVLYNRLGFSYNLLTPLILIAFWGGWEYLDRGRKWGLAFASMAIGIGSISDLMIISLILPVLIVVMIKDWHDLFWSLPLLGIPYGIYSIFMLLSVPDAFIFDMEFILFRLGSIPTLMQLPLLALNFGALYTWDSWLAAGIIGLFILKPRRWQRYGLLFFLLPLIILGRSTVFSGLGFYYMSPMLPFVALGVASLILTGIPAVFSFFQTGISDLINRVGIRQNQIWLIWISRRFTAFTVGVSVFLVAFSPIVISAILTHVNVIYGFETPIDAVLVDGEQASEVIDSINQMVDKEDLVIASPAIAWAIDSRVSDFQISLAADGKVTEHFPTDIPADRFEFDPRLENARYVIIDDIWRNWAVKAMSEVEIMMDQIDDWPIILEKGEFVVYENPAK